MNIKDVISSIVDVQNDAVEALSSNIDVVCSITGSIDLINQKFLDYSTKEEVDYLSSAIDTLNGLDSTNGSVAKSIKDSMDSLSGIIGSGFDSEHTVKEYIDSIDTGSNNFNHDEIDYLSGAIDTLNGSESTNGSVAKSINDLKNLLSSIIGGNFDSVNTIYNEISNFQNHKIDSILFRIPEISDTEFLHFNIEFSNSDDFSNITYSLNTSNSETYTVIIDIDDEENEYDVISGLRVFTGMKMIGFPIDGIGSSFSREFIRFDISGISEKYYRFQWIFGDDNSDELVSGRFGFGEINSIMNISYEQ